MNKDQYLEYRRRQEIIPVAYHFFNSQNKYNLIPYHVFSKLFLVFIRTSGSALDWNILWSLYDNDFSLSILYSIKNEIIKIT